MPRVIDESDYFQIEEFSRSGTYPDLVEPVPDIFRKNVERLVRGVLHPLRVLLAMPFTVLSGYRNKALNEAVGGSVTSQHRFAEAGDIACANPELLFRTAFRSASSLDLGQCIYYPAKRFIHFALPSTRYPKPSFHIHDPARGMEYRVVTTEDEITRLLSVHL
jgi:hypothetical protein